jgi:hypothetical protein
MAPEGTGTVTAARLALRIVGRQARRLADGGGEAVVIARFARSAYVRDDRGQLACVGGDELGLGPLNALAAASAFEHVRLAAGDRVLLDAAAATLWRPRDIGAPAPDRARRAQAAIAAARRAVTPRGLAAMEDQDPVSARARHGLAALASWLHGGDDEVPAEARFLIGLGPGLTPAGDDALGGAMIALRAFGRPDTADRLARAILPLARERTSEISLAHLAAAAEGEGAAALHDTLAAAAADDRAATADGLQRLDRIGHSSGWDALTGAVIALRAII